MPPGIAGHRRASLTSCGPHFASAIPQISYSSTSTDLSDKTRFEYFSRVVPPDKYQAKAMADTARALGWTYVNTLADAGTYGEKGIQAFVDSTKNSGLCVSRTESIPRGADEAKLQDIMYSLLLSGENNADAIMMFASEDNCRKVLKAIRTLNLTHSVHLLASDSWGAKVHPVYRQEADAEGTVTILPKRHVIPGEGEARGFDATRKVIGFKSLALTGRDLLSVWIQPVR
ncbi:hypothetical protein RRG08_029082 [Elysia crispata]|uniref:Receptor ligand binding region domain-containing protein n=1 Tax=Elysia crispata TaxID=231223 RepID=A0AAE0ZKT6_9GAST|nr:hypothetical protein RRG08_029082 [Elysia crispata]